LSPNQQTLMSSASHHRSGAASGILGIAGILGQAMNAVRVALHLRIHWRQRALLQRFGLAAGSQSPVPLEVHYA
jgi:hypothetical protein